MYPNKLSDFTINLKKNMKSDSALCVCWFGIRREHCTELRVKCAKVFLHLLLGLNVFKWTPASGQ